MATADRYIRTGDGVPQIYPGDLRGIAEALRDAKLKSEKMIGCHRVDIVYGSDRVPFKIFEGGECIWQSEQLQPTRR
jgi:hypothetical protein